MSEKEGHNQYEGSEPTGEKDNTDHPSPTSPLPSSFSAHVSRSSDAGAGPASGSGAFEAGGCDGNGVNQDAKTSPPSKRPKGRTAGKDQGEGLPKWRLEQLRAAGRARGKQLKRDRPHQSKAGKARAARGDMSEIGRKGHARAVENDPAHQSKAARSPRKRRKKDKRTAGDNEETGNPTLDSDKQGQVEEGEERE